MTTTNSHDAMAAFVKSALSLLKREADESGNQLPLLEHLEPSYNEFGTVSVDFTIRMDFAQFAVRYQSEIEKSLEYQNALRTLQLDPLVQRHFTGRMGDRKGETVGNPDFSSLVGNAFVKRFLLSYIETFSSFDFDQAKFSTIYDAMDSFLSNDQIEYVLLAPIPNFDCQTEPVQLTRDLQLRKFTESELQRILRSSRFGSVSFHELSLFRFAVSHEFRVGKTVAMDFTGKPREEIDTVIQALNLWKHGSVSVNLYFLMPTNLWIRGIVNMISVGSPRPALGLRYTISDDELNGFRRFYERFALLLDTLRTKKKMHFARIALRRFMSSVGETEHEDSLIDMLIALEAIYIESGESGELGYRLSLRAGALLGKDGDEANQIQAFLRKAYDLRSKVVHGKEVRTISIDGKELQLTEVVDRTGEYLRRSLCALIPLATKYSSQDEILNVIDASLFDTRLQANLRGIV
jgi:hypothetical protein